MSASDPATSADIGGPSRRGAGRLAVGLWVGLLAATAPLMSVITPAAWMLGVVALTGTLLAASWLARRRRVPAAVVTIIEAAIWLGVITAVFFSDSALFGVIPSPEMLHDVPVLLQQAAQEILLGVAPMPATTPVSFLVVAAVGVLTIALDHVVLTARMPLLAGIALIAVWLIPAIAVPQDVNLVGFALLAASVLFLIRAETRTREAPDPARRGETRRTGGVAAVAATIATVSIVGAMVGGAVLPQPDLTGAGGPGLAASIDPTLELGDDLRRRADVSVLDVRTDAPSMPYLRVATLSVFDGAVWQPDRLRSVSLADEGFDPLVVDEDIRVTEYRTHVRVGQLNSAYLPVPFPAVDIEGLDGSWRAVPFSRTVLSGQSNAYGQEYEVVTHLPRPTLEQIRAAHARVLESRSVDVWSVPEGTPEMIGDLAREVTADATTDYDRLVALQSWFRGSAFSYSLSAPVREGFDGTGLDAVVSFLEEKTGYCVHFAGAFALMARTLGMPSRIVVGFLPGDYTGDSEEGQRLAEVSTSKLHAWPEVYFDKIGWVPFEPTKGLGTATRFVTAGETPIDDGGIDVAGPTPTATPSASGAVRPDERDQPDDAAAVDGAAKSVDLRPYLVTLLVLLAVGALPLLAAALRRRTLRSRARDGAIAAAWRIVQDTAVDLGISVPAAESPRAFGARLVGSGGAGAARDAMTRLVGAVERASYGPGGAASGAGAGPVVDATAIRSAMLSSTDRRRRIRALLLPRSLLVRPGSALAVRDTTAEPIWT